MTARSRVEAVSIGWRLPVAEVGTVPATSNPAGNSGLLDGLANHDAVLLELLGQDGIQEGVAAAVQGEDENGEDLGLLKTDQLQSRSCSYGKESNWRPANEVGKNKQRHPLGNSGVVGIPSLGSPDGAVHFQVASHQDRECHAVDQHQKDDKAQAESIAGFKWKADGKLPVV